MKDVTFIKMNNALQAYGRNSMKAIHSWMIRQMKEKVKPVISEGKILKLTRTLKRP